MIYLKYDIENDITVTLQENLGNVVIPTGITATCYTMILTNLQTLVDYTYNFTDNVSLNWLRYDEFKLTIDSSLPSGYYNYAFRLKDANSDTYLSDVLEIGKCLVGEPTFTPSEIKYSGNSNNEIIVYKS